MPSPILRVLAFLVLVAAWGRPGVAADQVELHLASGQTLTGELVSEGTDSVVVKISVPTKNGKPMSMDKEYKRSEITQLVRLQDPEVAYDERKQAAKSADEHAALATWCRDHQMTDRAVEQARLALGLDDKQQSATKVLTDLGWVQVDGTWMKESDWLAGQGKVRYGDTIMTIAEADALKAQEKRQTARKEAQQAVDDKTAALAALDKRIADLPKRPAEIDKDIAKDTADLAPAQGASQRGPMTKKALDDAQKRLSDAQNAASRTQGAAGGTRGAAGAPAAQQQNLAPLQQAVEDAQKAYNAARREGSGSEQDAARLKAKIAALTDEKKNLARKGEDLKAQREALAKELEKAKAALAESAKQAEATPPTAPATTP